jgi:hypothetical protein
MPSSKHESKPKFARCAALLSLWHLIGPLFVKVEFVIFREIYAMDCWMRLLLSSRPEASAAVRDETKGYDLPDGARYGCGVKSGGRGATVQ